jgi:hypothetical protein
VTPDVGTQLSGVNSLTDVVAALRSNRVGEGADRRVLETKESARSGVMPAKNNNSYDMFHDAFAHEDFRRFAVLVSIAAAIMVLYAAVYKVF